jgi:hypothetical protein
MGLAHALELSGRWSVAHCMPLPRVPCAASGRAWYNLVKPQTQEPHKNRSLGTMPARMGGLPVESQADLHDSEHPRRQGQKSPRITTEFLQASRQCICPAANFLLRQVFGDDESPATIRRWIGAPRDRDPTDKGVRCASPSRSSRFLILLAFLFQFRGSSGEYEQITS